LIEKAGSQPVRPVQSQSRQSRDSAAFCFDLRRTPIRRYPPMAADGSPPPSSTAECPSGPSGPNTVWLTRWRSFWTAVLLRRFGEDGLKPENPLSKRRSTGAIQDAQREKSPRSKNHRLQHGSATLPPSPPKIIAFVGVGQTSQQLPQPEQKLAAPNLVGICHLLDGVSNGFGNGNWVRRQTCVSPHCGLF
jgi:hypothetical protein